MQPPERPGTDGSTIKCPNCNTDVDVKAERCQNCGTEMVEKKGAGIGTLALIVVLLAALVALFVWRGA